MSYFLDSDKITYIEKFEPEHVYVFSGKCVISGKEVSVSIKSLDLYLYNRGTHIQTAFPYLTPDEREWLMTGIFEFPKFDESNGDNEL